MFHYLYLLSSDAFVLRSPEKKEGLLIPASISVLELYIYIDGLKTAGERKSFFAARSARTTGIHLLMYMFACARFCFEA